MRSNANRTDSVISNERAFDRYKRFIEGDAKHGAALIPGTTGLGLYLQVTAFWGGRYTRRRNILEGGRDYNDRMADSIACRLLMERNRRADEDVKELPDWDASTRSMVESCLRNSHQTSLHDAQIYGPSLRRLWAQAKQQGLSGNGAWMSIVSWARHLPPAFATEEKMRRNPGEFLNRPLAWTSTGELITPWQTTVDGSEWRVRLNDFPDDVMYSLIVEGRDAGGFHDWPKTWSREGQPAEPQAVPVAKAPAAGGFAPARWMDRYSAGDCEKVWAEMISLGPDVRKKANFSHAQLVSRETMRRARVNLETIVKRLRAMNYRFWQPPDQVWIQPSGGEHQYLIRLEGQKLVLPISIASWIEDVGKVDLNGSHPLLAAMDGETHFQGFYADPLMVSPDLPWTEEEWEGARADGEEEIALIVGWDDLGKAGLYQDAQVDVEYVITVPNSAADAPLAQEWHETDFVNYLRIAFRWGGFPGWERYSRRPETELRILREGMLEL